MESGPGHGGAAYRKTNRRHRFRHHDAGNGSPASSDRIAGLAQTVTEELPELDFRKQTFDTPALLGDLVAGTALTNVALAIAYANHLGKTVLVTRTTDETQQVATRVVPPRVVRPTAPDKPWFRARGGNHVRLPWWGLRHGSTITQQGFSRWPARTTVRLPLQTRDF